MSVRNDVAIEWWPAILIAYRESFKLLLSYLVFVLVLSWTIA